MLDVNTKNGGLPHNPAPSQLLRDVSGDRTAEVDSRHAEGGVAGAGSGKTGRGVWEGSERDGAAGHAEASISAAQKKKPAPLAWVAGVSASNSEGASSRKRPCRVNTVPALGVPIKREEVDRLIDDTGGSSSKRRRARPTGGILLRPTPSVLSVAGGGAAAVKTEVDVRGQEGRGYPNP